MSNMVKLENVDYKILNPGGNKTALVYETVSYTKEEKEYINNMILSENKDVEQVGFLNIKNKTLNMAGGEFCANATRCAIWELLDGKIGQINLTVSGYNSKISGGIRENKNVYEKLIINKTLNELVEVKDKYIIVKLDGIYHVVIGGDLSSSYISKLILDEEKTKKDLKELMKKLDMDIEAMGVMLLENQNNEVKINPIVWVKSIDTVYYETACGSGSLATAIYLNYLNKINSVDIIQPSNYKIKVDLNTDNKKINYSVIEGIVED